MKVRFKIRIETGRKAAALNAQQAEAIKEYCNGHASTNQNDTGRRRQAPTRPAEPVPVAVLARTSTLALQDPVASLNRQIRSCQAGYRRLVHRRGTTGTSNPAASTWRHRSQGQAWQPFAAAGHPPRRRHGRPAHRGQAPRPGSPPSSARTSNGPRRDTFNALKLEKELSREGIPLFATDEPAEIEGINATTVLVRRVKQGVAEWFRLQLKEKIWKGLQEHSLAGWNIGTRPYGYAADRIPHPARSRPPRDAPKAGSSSTPTAPRGRPDLRPGAPWTSCRSRPSPRRLNADPAAYPAPDGSRWTRAAPWPRSWPTPSTPATWSTAAPATARSRQRRAPSRPTSGSGPPSPTHPAHHRPWPPGTTPRTPAAERGNVRDTGTPATRPRRRLHRCASRIRHNALPAAHVRHVRDRYHRTAQHLLPRAPTTRPTPATPPTTPTTSARPGRQAAHHDRSRRGSSTSRLRPRPRRPARRPAPRHRRRETADRDRQAAALAPQLKPDRDRRTALITRTRSNPPTRPTPPPRPTGPHPRPLSPTCTPSAPPSKPS